MSFVPFFILWTVIALAVLALIAYRRIVAQREDQTMHMLEPAVVEQQQASVGHKLEQIDKWGKLLTIIAAVYGFILVAAYVYQSWVQSSNIGV